MRRNPKVDHYLDEKERWREELDRLRGILLDSPLTEEFKWGYPCYTFQKGNVVGLNRLKEYCVLGFFKGSLLKDIEGILISPGKHSQAMRQIRFTTVQEIVGMDSILKAYIDQAIEVEKSGLKVDFKKDEPLVLPDELQNKLAELPALKTAFNALTLGRQRAYNLYFSAPKQSQTRTSRVEKYIPRILQGKGMHDCVCGLSKKLPACDGSHKSIQPIK